MNMMMMMMMLMIALSIITSTTAQTLNSKCSINLFQMMTGVEVCELEIKMFCFLQAYIFTAVRQENQQRHDALQRQQAYVSDTTNHHESVDLDSDEFIEQFINECEKYPMLYNRNSQNFMSGKAREQYYDKIAAKFCITTGRRVGFVN